MEPEPTDEIEVPRDELIWPVDPSAGIDIYSGLMLPTEWEGSRSGYASSALATAAMFQTSGPGSDPYAP